MATIVILRLGKHDIWQINYGFRNGHLQLHMNSPGVAQTGAKTCLSKTFELDSRHYESTSCTYRDERQRERDGKITRERKQVLDPTLPFS